MIMVVTFPPFLGAWLIIHPLAAFWRRLGPGRSYSLILVLILSSGFLLYQFRLALMGRDRGANWISVALGLALYLVALRIEIRCRRHLSLGTLIGLPEISPSKHGAKLLTRGIYAQVRHPRYLSVLIGTAAFALVVNYTGILVLALLTVPLIYLITVLEERELVARFGQRYRLYRQRVPRLIPRLRFSRRRS